MAVFAILSLLDSQETREALGAKIKDVYPNDHFVLAPGRWMVRGDGIAKEVSDKLGVTAGAFGHAIVFSVSGYFGWANNTVWEWLALKSMPPLATPFDVPPPHG
jgi:hypothetical protein